MSRISLHHHSGGPASFDLMQTADGSHNLLITGEPGSGKTTLTKMLADSASSLGHCVRIATTGNNYRNSAPANNALYQESSVFRPIPLNPFSSVSDWNQDRLGVQAVFTAIIRHAVGSDIDLLPSVLTLTQEAVSKAWIEQLHQADISTVYKGLSSFDGVPLKTQYTAESALQPFLPGEIYEKWLVGPAVDITTQPYTIFNLDNLMIATPLFKAVVPALLHLFCTDASRCTGDRPRLIVIDNLWHLHVPTATMTTLLRHGTDSHTAVVMGLDSFDDLRLMTVGKIVIANCRHGAFFPSPAMSFNYDVFIEAGIPEAALDLVDSQEGRRRHLFYLTPLNDTFALDLSQPIFPLS